MHAPTEPTGTDRRSRLGGEAWAAIKTAVFSRSARKNVWKHTRALWRYVCRKLRNPALRPGSPLLEDARLRMQEKRLRAERLLDAIQAERLHAPFDLDAFLAAHPQALILSNRDIPGLDAYFAGHALLSLDDDFYEIMQCDLIVAWLYRSLYGIVDVAEHGGRPLVFFEDAFLKSVLATSERGEDRFTRNYAFFVDDLGYHFDATRASRLECMLNDAHGTLSEAERGRGRAIRSLLLETRLTKYNCPVTPFHAPGRPGAPKILVVDQHKGDASVIKSRATAHTFQRMLAAALEQNPEADVIVKRHPDAIARGADQSYFAHLPHLPHLAAQDRVFSITERVNPYILLDSMDKVYVCSSMLGLEALMAGKETHVFGLPCYAGWGLSVDYQHCPRRTRSRDIEELVFIIYARYTRYLDPEGRRIEAEDAIPMLARLRDECFGAARS